MQEQRYSLCPACDACPEVVVEGEEVVIGEPGNEARLTGEQWNVLVDAVQTGKLRRIGTEDGMAKSCDCGCECC